MNNQILMKLKGKLEELGIHGKMDVETERNALKEDLQYYVLNFIYHHPKYSNWTMYGGSALRICHNLNRMSVDLDFEITESCTEEFLNNLKTEIETHFSNTYDTGAEFLTIKLVHGRGLRLNLNIGDELGIGHPSKQVHVKIDLNQFTAPKTVIERIPINSDQLSFVIKTYNMSALMASKIAAIFLRGTRGIDDAIYEEKGRDIYDLLWYMQKKALPDLDYLKAKSIDITDLRSLFDKLTLKMNDVSNTNLEQDLKPLFIDQNFITDWLKNWHTNYFHLLNKYEIRKVKKLIEVLVRQDFHSDNFSFTFYYETEEDTTVRIIYTVSDYWMTFRDGDIPTEINDKVVELAKIEFRDIIVNKLKQYVTLFYEKTEAYFQKTNHIMIGDGIITKTIIMTAGNFNQKEQIVLNKSALLSCELEDLLK